MLLPQFQMHMYDVSNSPTFYNLLLAQSPTCSAYIGGPYGGSHTNFISYQYCPKLGNFYLEIMQNFKGFFLMGQSMRPITLHICREKLGLEFIGLQHSLQNPGYLQLRCQTKKQLRKLHYLVLLLPYFFPEKQR